MNIFDSSGEPIDDPAFGNYTLSDLKFNGFTVAAHVIDLVTSADVELSIEEASTLTLGVHDPERILESAGLFDEATDLDVGKHEFRFVKVKKDGDDFTLTFENRWVAKLRLVDKPKKASRAKVTRAEFIKSMVDETPGIVFWAPDLHQRQAITSAAEGTTAAAAASSRSPGVASSASLKVKGKAADAEQKRVMNAVMAAAATTNPTPRALLALVQAIIVECEFRNKQGSGADSISFGVIQNIPGRSAGLNGTFTKAQALDIDYSVRSALLPPGPTSKGGLIKLAKEHPDWSPGKVAAVAINGGGDPAYASKADSYKAEAEAIIAAFGGASAIASAASTGGSSSGSTSVTVAKQYEFTRGTDQGKESTWDAAKRLCDEVQRRRFMVDNEFVCAFDGDLINQKPAATITELTDGVNYIDYERDAGKRVESCTVSCRADAWAARPGDVVVVADGGAEGRWLVSRVSGSLFFPDRSIEMIRAARKLKEPAHETTTRTTDATAITGSGGTSAGAAAGDKHGSWKYAPGVPKTLNAKMRSFLDRMATFYDGTIVVTTTTNHSYLTDSGNVSDHNGGGAADLGSVANWGGQIDGEGGTRLAIAAYRACGLSYAEAVKRAATPSYTRVPCPESSRGAQILWRVAGHHDHVHIGIGA